MKVNSKILPDLVKFIELRYAVDITQHQGTPLWDATLELQHQLDEAILHRYFGYDSTTGGQDGYWKQQLRFETRRTGAELADKLKALGPRAKILDIGCGDNEFKTHVGDNVFGIDPYNTRSDSPVDIMDFHLRQRQWDAVLCLGSINFGDIETIKLQVAKAVHMAKSGGSIYWRCNPGITHDNAHAKWVDFFAWTQDILNEFAEENKCDIVDSGYDHPGTADEIRWGNRIYNEWKKR